jgi:hypothetical protein
MSHLSLAVSSVLIVASACSTPEPPAAASPESPVVSSGESTPPLTPADTPAEVAASAPAASPQLSVQRLFVRDRLAQCQTEAAKKCLQVRSSETEEWRNLYSPIEGFDYEESNAYELRVEVSEVASPRADGSSLRYRLLEVLSKHASAGTSKSN